MFSKFMKDGTMLKYVLCNYYIELKLIIDTNSLLFYSRKKEHTYILLRMKRATAIKMRYDNSTIVTSTPCSVPLLHHCGASVG